MSEENKEAARRLWEEFRGEDKGEVADELLAANFVGTDESTGAPQTKGPAGAKEELAMYRGAFPDMKISVTDQSDDGDEVTTSWRVNGTHDGDLMGIAPTGKSVEITGTSVHTFADGKIAKETTKWDFEGLLEQIGATPADIQQPA